MWGQVAVVYAPTASHIEFKLANFKFNIYRIERIKSHTEKDEPGVVHLLVGQIDEVKGGWEHVIERRGRGVVLIITRACCLEKCRKKESQPRRFAIVHAHSALGGMSLFGRGSMQYHIYLVWNGRMVWNFVGAALDLR